MRKLYLFKEAWNFGNNVHINFDNITKEKWFNLVKSANLGYASYEPNNYRIVNGIVTISGDVLNTYSYIIEIDEDLIDDPEGKIGKQVFKYWHCYFIKSITKRSGYSILSCDTDVWGTFYPYVELSNIHVSRCNRNIGRGRFDPINAFDSVGDGVTDNWYKAIGGHETTTTGINYLNNSEISAVFVANCVVSQSGSGNNSITATMIFSFPFVNLETVFASYDLTSVEIVTRLIAGIYGLPTSSGLVVLNCDITHVYILPSIYVITDSNTIYTFKSRPSFSPATDLTLACSLVKPNLTRYYVNLNVADLSPNYHWTLGVRDEGLELPRSTKDEMATLFINFNYDGLNISVRQNDQVKDITHAFEIGIVGQTQEVDKLGKIVNAFKWTLNTIQNALSIGSSLNARKYEQALDKSFSYATKLADNFSNRANASGNVSNADGYITFSYQKDKCFYPFYLTFKRSAIDEEQHARLYGASFDTTISWFGEIYSYPVFYATDYDTTFTYVQCEAEIKKAPADACNYIKSVLAGGVWLGTGTEDNIDLML